MKKALKRRNVSKMSQTFKLTKQTVSKISYFSDSPLYYHEGKWWPLILNVQALLEQMKEGGLDD